jgi:5'-nucleotidase/UDP-sugar diphosphatase
MNSWKNPGHIYMIMSLLLAVVLIALSCAPAANPGKSLKEIQTPPLSLTILHVNDTHGYVIPHDELMKFNGMTTLATVGGYSLLDSAVEDIRNRQKNVLLLHGGDILEGTIWSTRFEGMADVDAMNAMRFDAFVPGNHEFSKSVQEAANLFNRAKFPVLAANMDVSKELLLADKIKPFAIVEFDGQKIGIIGLITPDTAFLSYPGKNAVFLSPEESATRYITELNHFGINKIIILSHLGYEHDVTLAKTVPGIDIIVGGHTATFMGGPEFEQIGLKPEMPYPIEVAGPDGGKVLIVHAWEYNRLLGQITLDFDDKGLVTGYKAQPFIFSTNGFKIEDDWGWSHLCPCRTEYSQIMQAVANNPGFKIYWNSPEMDSILEPYINQVSSELNSVVAVADENIIRGTNKGPGPIIADAFLWSARKANPEVQFAIYDTYNIRSDIYKGNILSNDVYMLLPLRQSLATMSVKGSMIKMLLEMGLDSHLKINDPPPCYELSGISMTINMNNKSGDRITAIQVKQPDGSYSDMDMNADYTMATTDYLADKGIQPLVNKVNWLGPAADSIKSWIKDYFGYRVLGITDVNAMSDYLRVQTNMKNVNDERSKLIPATK